MKQAGAEQVVEPVVEPVPVDEDYGDEDLDDDEKVTYRDYLLEKPKTPREKKNPSPKSPMDTMLPCKNYRTCFLHFIKYPMSIIIPLELMPLWKLGTLLRRSI